LINGPQKFFLLLQKTLSGGTVITKDEFARLLSHELDILSRQTEGLTHHESLLQPQPGGNCLNWIIGHLVGNLVIILSVLAGDPPSGLPDLEHYGYGSEPVPCDEPGVIELPVLIDAYALLTKTISERLAQMTEADFNDEIDFWQSQSRRGYVAFFYFFHNTYHIGQLEQLRNLAGKTEKVI
jgi:hypothetical protein